MHSSGHKTPRKTIEYMRELRAEGYSNHYIAQACNVSANCVKHYTADIPFERPTPLANREINDLLRQWSRA